MVRSFDEIEKPANRRALIFHYFPFVSSPGPHSHQRHKDLWARGKNQEPRKALMNRAWRDVEGVGHPLSLDLLFHIIAECLLKGFSCKKGTVLFLFGEAPEFLKDSLACDIQKLVRCLSMGHFSRERSAYRA